MAATIYSSNEQKQVKKLNEIVKKSSKVLFQARSVIPFKLFPKKIIVDTEKITIIEENFLGLFKPISIIHIPLLGVRLVKLTTGAFFGKISIELQGFEQNPEPMDFLTRKAAIQAEKVISGLIIAQKEEVDFSQIGKEEILSKIIKVGTTKSDKFS
jgi:hypothetical protein